MRVDCPVLDLSGYSFDDDPGSPCRAGLSLASYISFAYNVGDSAFRSSTLLELHNQGRYREACEQMRRWVYVTVAGIKVKLAGLANRRDKEVALCLSGLG